ncbi:hypothetical protein D4764_05G0006620 [Takifugu flavidus]|uniref:Uncharacterized protein n=1 Tax=Takifugu flavidus TaxID=433684 RepID=A0A5C6MZI3_9TELE|nr:hypothetical protein D4764_05G0006620 [Takifugu flavidus]
MDRLLLPGPRSATLGRAGRPARHTRGKRGEKEERTERLFMFHLELPSAVDPRSTPPGSCVACGCIKVSLCPSTPFPPPSPPQTTYPPPLLHPWLERVASECQMYYRVSHSNVNTQPCHESRVVWPPSPPLSSPSLPPLSSPSLPRSSGCQRGGESTKQQRKSERLCVNVCV